MKYIRDLAIIIGTIFVIYGIVISPTWAGFIIVGTFLLWRSRQ